MLRQFRWGITLSRVLSNYLAMQVASVAAANWSEIRTTDDSFSGGNKATRWLATRQMTAPVDRL